MKKTEGKKHSPIKYIFLAVISGVFIGFSFPYFNLFFLPYFFLVPLFFLSERNNYKITFFSAIFSGLIGYGIVIYWIYPTVVENTGSILQGFISIFLLACYLSLYLAIFLVLHRFVFTLSPITHPLLSIVSSALWVSLEYLRTHLLTGFPWALIGYSQWNNLVVSQISDITGVYGVSFFVVLVNITLYKLLKNRIVDQVNNSTLSGSEGSNPSNRMHYLGIKEFIPNIILILSVLIYGLIKSHPYSPFVKGCPATSGTEYLKIAVIQPNIDQYKKWDKNYYTEVTQKIKSQVLSAAGFESEVILWPETSVSDITSSSQIFPWLKEVVVKSGRFNLVGGFWQEGDKIYNSAFLLSPESKIKYLHKKTHLVPFGEFVPFRKFLEPYFDVFNYIGDQTRGREFTTMAIDGKNFGALICSENLFPHIARRFVKNGAEAILVITNNAWFGKTSAAFQHFTFNIFRAIESRRFVVQSANTGVSGVVAPSGKILKSTDIFKDDCFVFEIPLVTDKTFYTKFGDIFTKICVLISTASVILALLIRKLNHN